MSLIHKYFCEICGAEKKEVHNWFMAEVTCNGVLISHWREDKAQSPGIRHFCGEAHAQVFLSRYLAAPQSFTANVRPLNTSDKDLTAVQSHLVSKVMQQPSEVTSEELFDLLAAAEAALKGRITIDLLSNEHFDA